MIGYRNKTFCPFYGNYDCNYLCNKALTPEIKTEASKINLPVWQFINLSE